MPFVIPINAGAVDHLHRANNHTGGKVAGLGSHFSVGLLGRGQAGVDIDPAADVGAHGAVLDFLGATKDLLSVRLADAQRAVLNV